MIFNHFQVCDYNENNCELFSTEECSLPFNLKLESNDPIVSDSCKTINLETCQANQYSPLALHFGKAQDIFEDMTFSSMSQPKENLLTLPILHEEAINESEIVIRKSKFTPHEDENLKEYVAKYGRNWALIAKLIPNKERKQVRERYDNFLVKKLNRKSFSAEEDLKILDLIEKMGTKFYKIAEQLEGRTAIMVKNRYYSKLLKQKLIH